MGSALDELPFVIDLADRPVEIAVRHRPDEASVRLLETLGVRWRIDENAPRCERRCGHSRCARSASELRELAARIDEETRRRNLSKVRERVERSIEDGCVVVRDPRDVALVSVAEQRKWGEVVQTEDGPVWSERTCKIDGCENRANARYDRGILAGLCWETHVPEGKSRYSERGRAAATARAERERPAARTVLPEPQERHPWLRNPEPVAEPPEPEDDRHEPEEPVDEPPTPEPEPTPEPVDEESEAVSFAEAAVAVELTREKLRDAQAAYDAALRRFAAHPTYGELQVDLDDILKEDA